MTKNEPTIIIPREEVLAVDKVGGENRDRDIDLPVILEKTEERLAELTDPAVWEKEFRENLEKAERDLEFAESSMQARIGTVEVVGELSGAPVTIETITQAQAKIAEVRENLEKIKAMDLKSLSASAAEGIKVFVKENMLSLTPLLLGPIAILTGGSVGLAVRASVELTAGMYALDKVLDKLMESAEEIIPPQYLVALVAGTTNLAEMGASQASAFSGDPISEVGSTPLGSNPTNLYLTVFALISAMKQRAVTEGIVQPGEKLGIKAIKQVLQSLDLKNIKKQGGTAALFALDAMLFQFYVRPQMKKGDFIPFAAWSAINAPIMFEYFRRTTFSKKTQLGNYAERIGENQIEQLKEGFDENQTGASPIFELLETINLYQNTEDKKERKVLMDKLHQAVEVLRSQIEEDGDYRRQLQDSVSSAAMGDLQKFLKMAGVGENVDVLRSINSEQMDKATVEAIQLREDSEFEEGAESLIKLLSSLDSYKQAKTKEQKAKALQKVEDAYYEVEIEMDWDEEFAKKVEQILADEGLSDFKSAFDQLKTGKQELEKVFGKIDNLGIVQNHNLLKFGNNVLAEAHRKTELLSPFVDLMVQVSTFKRAKNKLSGDALFVDIKNRLNNLEKRADLDPDFAKLKQEILAREDFSEIQKLIEVRLDDHILKETLQEGKFKDSAVSLAGYQEVNAELCPQVGRLIEKIHLLRELKKEEKIGQVERNLRAEIKSMLAGFSEKMQGSELLEQELTKALSSPGGEIIPELIQMTSEKRKKIKHVRTIVGGMASIMGLSVLLDKGVTDMAESTKFLGKGAAGFFIMSFFSSIGEYLTTKKFFERGEDKDAIKNIADSNAINVGLAKGAVASSAIRGLFV
ncbi:hypothetical protein HQ571_06280 [Candidatus Kuenenbacteria bacterium]|nr:hypothetical protein [Candidatus Kuenenbacteria bacterium]